MREIKFRAIRPQEITRKGLEVFIESINNLNKIYERFKI